MNFARQQYELEIENGRKVFLCFLLVVMKKTPFNGILRELGFGTGNLYTFYGLINSVFYG